MPGAVLALPHSGDGALYLALGAGLGIAWMLATCAWRRWRTAKETPR